MSTDMNWWMDGWDRVLRPFISISVISRRWKGEYERLCAMKRRLDSGRISLPAGFEPATPWTDLIWTTLKMKSKTVEETIKTVNLSRLVTKPTMWLCAHRRLRSTWASAQIGQSSLSAWRNLGPLVTHWAHSEDWSDWAGLLVSSRSGSFHQFHHQTENSNPLK